MIRLDVLTTAYLFQRWKEFFGMKSKGSDEKKNLYAMSKLIQIALVQYMKLRGVYPDRVFIKKSYPGLISSSMTYRFNTYLEYEFFIINTEDEQGAKLIQNVNTASRLINLKAVS